METRTSWKLFFVDDDPEVHAITRLMLTHERFFGLPVELYFADSAAEAREFFVGNPDSVGTAVALIDVVMETDDAGLELCRWIREERKDNVMQLLLRTGQPGKAPPRKVIDTYDISGYLHKVEITGDRLYMSVKTAIRQYYDAQYLFRTAQYYDHLRRVSRGPGDLIERVRMLASDDPLEELGIAYHRGRDLGKTYIGEGELHDRERFEALKAELWPQISEELGRNGIAQVDDCIVIQTKAAGSQELSTMIVKGAVFPRGLVELYGSVWRQELAYLAEVASAL